VARPGLWVRVGEGYQTRTISLGICGIRAFIPPDLLIHLPESDCEVPVFTAANDANGTASGHHLLGRAPFGLSPGSPGRPRSDMAAGADDEAGLGVVAR
jgi:hypothetical protein